MPFSPRISSMPARLTAVRRLPVRAWLAAALLGAAALFPAATAHAVSVSPNALYLDNRNRAGMLTLFNNGTLPEEIEITFAFGYPVSDSIGDVSVQLFEVAPDGEPSAVPFLRAFPRRLRLAPGQRQVVRILVNPPAGLAEGEYWARIIIKSRGGQPPIEQQEGDLRLRLDLETVIIAAASYRNGSVGTGLAMERVTVDSSATDSVVATFDLARTGNAAWIGRLVTQLVAPDGQVVAQAEDQLAVYHRLRYRATVERPAGLASLSGYTVRFAFDTTRPDLPPEGPLPASRVEGEAPVP